MKQIRLSSYSSNDLSDYLDRGFIDDELEQIRLALEDGLPIDLWLTDDMYVQQIHEIRIGMYEGLDVGIYANSQYNWMQMREIRLGLEKKLKVETYTNYLFSHWQMQEIRLGLEAGLDVSSYAKLIFSASDMKQKRQKLMTTRTPETVNADKLGIVLSEIAKKEFSILVENNGNKAFAFIPWVPGNMVTEADIYESLESRGIVNGIRHEAITELIKKRSLKQISRGDPRKKSIANKPPI